MKGEQIKNMVENVVAIICFALLAVIFRHWWISLFSLIFLLTEDDRRNKNSKKSKEDNNADTADKKEVV